MARPKEKEIKIQQTVMLKPSVVEEIEKMADKIGVTKSQLMGNLISVALEEVRGMERFGLLSGAVLVSEIMKKFKKALFSGKVSLNDEGELEIKK